MAPALVGGLSLAGLIALAGAHAAAPRPAAPPLPAAPRRAQAAIATLSLPGGPAAPVQATAGPSADSRPQAAASSAWQLPPWPLPPMPAPTPAGVVVTAPAAPRSQSAAQAPRAGAVGPGVAAAAASPLRHIPAAVRRDVAVAARETGLPQALLAAVVEVESEGNALAVSPAGAMGLMQLEPPTAASLGVSDAFDPSQNTRGGARYLAGLLLGYAGDDRQCLADPAACPRALRLALAAYNAGPGAVRRYGGVPPYSETQRYVRSVTQLYRQWTASTGATG